MTEYTLKTAARIIHQETGEPVEKIERRIAAALASDNPDAAAIIALVEKHGARRMAFEYGAAVMVPVFLFGALAFSPAAGVVALAVVCVGLMVV